MKNVILILIVALTFSGKLFGQATPQELSNAFTNSLINFNEEKLKALLPADPKEQQKMLEQLKQIYSSDMKPLKGMLLSSSTRAVLKDGDKTYKERADIFITITDNQKIKYELKLWGCGARSADDCAT